jgi:hypothetical protein
MSDIKKITMFDDHKYDVNVDISFDKDNYERYMDSKNTFAEVLYLQLIREYYEWSKRD